VLEDQAPLMTYLIHDFLDRKLLTN
jgi:hypothetical protein